MNEDRTEPMRFSRKDEKDPKTEPVRMSSLIAIITAAVMILLDKFGVANFTAVEVSIILSAIIALANEVARMKVWAPRKSEVQ